MDPNCFAEVRPPSVREIPWIPTALPTRTLTVTLTPILTCAQLTLLCTAILRVAVRSFCYGRALCISLALEPLHTRLAFGTGISTNAMAAIMCPLHSRTHKLTLAPANGNVAALIDLVAADPLRSPADCFPLSTSLTTPLCQAAMPSSNGLSTM